MQIAVIKYSRDVANIPDANSGEFDEQCKNRVIDFMPGQSEDIDKGGTLRLGAYPCVIESGTTMERCYGTQLNKGIRFRIKKTGNRRSKKDCTKVSSYLHIKNTCKIQYKYTKIY